MKRLQFSLRLMLLLVALVASFRCVMHRYFTLLLVMAILSFGQTTNSAIGQTFEPVYSQAYNSTLSPIGTPANVAIGDYVQFDFRLDFRFAAAGEDFWRAVFNIQPRPELTPVDLFGVGKWMTPATAESKGLYSATGFSSPPPALQSFAQYDSNGPAAGGIESHWQISNSDPGNDLLAITVQAASTEAANRQYGELARPTAGYADQLGSPSLLGTVLFQATALGFGVGHISPATPFPSTISWFGTYENNQSSTGVPTDQPPNSYTSTTFGVKVVPEPTSLALMILASPWLIPLIWRRAVQLQPFKS